MTIASSEVRAEIRREARGAGLREFEQPSIESVERRRIQLWVLAAIVVVCLGAAITIASGGSEDRDSWLPSGPMRLGVLALALGFCAYAIEKEVHLRRLHRLLVEERVVNAALKNYVRQNRELSNAAKAVNSLLELPEMLDVILASSLDMLGADAGSIMLLEDDELVTLVVRGNDAARGARVRFGESVSGKVALTRQPLVLTGEVDPAAFPGHHERERPVESAMCVPLEHRGALLGVLNVNGGHARTFDEYDLHVLSLFSEPAAAALAHSRTYEAERSHVVELLEQDRLRSQFLAALGHELRTPLTSIRGAVGASRRTRDPAAHEELLEVIDRQVERLNTMVEEIQSAARTDRHASAPPLRRVDLAALVRLVAFDSQIAGRPVAVVATDRCDVRVDPESMRRVVSNLIENAHKYGRQPVRIEVTSDRDRALLSVIDSGDGIPVEEREKIFERYYRAQGTENISGSGLGLPIVRGLIEASGGRVWVEDGPEGGAAIRVSLPVRIGDDVEVARCPASTGS